MRSYKINATLRMGTILLVVSWCFCTSLKAQSWVHAGPYGGSVTALTVDPADTGIVYAGTYGAGVYKSTDGGQNWAPITNGFSTWKDSTVGSPTLSSWWSGDYCPVTLLRIIPQSPAHIYAGTAGGGIVQSEDAGKTWISSSQGLPDSATVSALWLNPRNPAELFCGLRYPHGGLYHSTEGGVNWSLIDGVPSGSTYDITTITHVPETPDTLYVGVSSAGELAFAWGLLRSTDGGQSWDTLSQDYSFYDLQIDLSNSENLWSVVHTSFLQWLLGHSNDGGGTWEFYPNMTDPWEPVLGLYADPAWNLYAIHGLGNPIRKSMDHGATWAPVAEAMPFYPLSVFPGTGPNIAGHTLDLNIVFFGSEVGVYRSDDGGQTVRLQENGMINTYISDVEVNPQNPSIIYAGGGQGFWKSEDGGESWLRLSTSSVNAIAIDPHHPDTVFWGGIGGLMRSYDGGDTQVTIREGIITALEIHPDSANILYVGIYRSTLLKTTDYGDSWYETYHNPTWSLWINDIDINRANPAYVYMAGASSGPDAIYYSKDAGDSWQELSAPGVTISIMSHTINPDRIYVATKKGVFVSTDGGTSFNDISGQVSASQMSTIVLDPEEPSHLLLGTKDQGVFVSADAGGTWSRLAGPYNPRITDLHFIPDDNHLYLGTHGGGVWRGDDISLGIKKPDKPPLPERIYLYSAYPNPFNAHTVLPFHIPHCTPVKVAIYSITGRMIKIFPEKMYSIGEHQITWDGTTANGVMVPSGVYMIRVQSGPAAVSRKLTLLK